VGWGASEPLLHDHTWKSQIMDITSEYEIQQVLIENLNCLLFTDKFLYNIVTCRPIAREWVSKHVSNQHIMGHFLGYGVQVINKRFLWYKMERHFLCQSDPCYITGNPDWVTDQNWARIEIGSQNWVRTEEATRSEWSQPRSEWKESSQNRMSPRQSWKKGSAKYLMWIIVIYCDYEWLY
jgi:hypothetical protein